MKYSLILIVIIFTYSCSVKKNSDNLNAINKNDKKMESLDYELIFNSYEHLEKESNVVLVTNKNQLKSIYNQLNLIRFPGLPIPKVNFENERILILNWKLKSLKNNDLMITYSYEEETTLKINLKEFFNKKYPNSSNFKTPFKVYKITTTSNKVFTKLVD